LAWALGVVVLWVDLKVPDEMMGENEDEVVVGREIAGGYVEDGIVDGINESESERFERLTKRQRDRDLLQEKIVILRIVSFVCLSVRVIQLR
jgi:hypothetical protein